MPERKEAHCYFCRRPITRFDFELRDCPPITMVLGPKMGNVCEPCVTASFEKPSPALKRVTSKSYQFRRPRD